MEWNIVALGSVGSGKTTAIRSVSDIDVVDTDAVATDETAQLKRTTTVAMDMGVMDLGNGDRLRLHGSPGQERFDFMWDILVAQARGALVFVDATRPDPVADMRFYLDAVRTRAKGRELPIVVGITHADRVPAFSLERYREAFSASRCSCSQCRPPIQRVDARSAHDVAMLLLVMSALLEAQQRVPERILHQQMSAGIAQAA